MAKVLLVNPPFYRLLGSHYNANSLGIAYIASYLNKRGHDAWLYNADYVSDKNYGNLKKLFQNYYKYKKNLFGRRLKYNLKKGLREYIKMFP